jgi:hypothetical protein
MARRDATRKGEERASGTGKRNEEGKEEGIASEEEKRIQVELESG